MNNPWLIPDNHIAAPDCLIVLSYAVKDKNKPVLPTKNLILTAYKIWKKFPGIKIILSTGDNQNLGLPNSAVMKKYALKIGIPPQCLLEEDRSRNTWENIKFSQEILKKNKLTRPQLVVLDLHARRAVATAKKLGWIDPHWTSVYSPGEPAYGWKAVQTAGRLTMLLWEILAYLYSYPKQWI
ncbi:MAG: hypothetical protein UX87_C0007G0040 [Candidatus Amesbacteria bacterium GW2011_GWA1_47_16]|uniref:DUF218 domain-containing protein n=4 Tax=Candidatus Amesiibacteriota TaxID=1752730 RepID=A0A0G1S477_9BACT|nr:MAG: hypothetical protein UX86_C0010G0029 [Candidatus Amesbacteria bacterium GW2011_GWC1_47_15]KKU64532.1 MAG: hypothetical protein UX87_C0007G0040 [Candidatus Amesbacteria bacterium GW2011_GWA1_47_16]KKU98076.1 MAG: hypothetical protein UY28_C0008G0022 [Candidatus Amesbacteria bacterium GW2011_GWB1_48_13]OGC98824.1 MAG: hypothetical protein A2701_02550 [Candidatus Amesbacteria bacterium RIFCSPHIGHO2_01_FULL_47_34]OGD01051.1 MAG: hypothetical protein A2972_03005 [Candidatus Amesbacteria bact